MTVVCSILNAHRTVILVLHDDQLTIWVKIGGGDTWPPLTPGAITCSNFNRFNRLCIGTIYFVVIMVMVIRYSVEIAQPVHASFSTACCTYRHKYVITKKRLGYTDG